MNMLDSSKYPATWSTYIGQEAATRMLQTAAKSARIRRAALPHILIAHPSPGIGKTALAVLIAKEMGTTVRVISGPLDRQRARMLFSEMEDYDVLLWDEAHQMMDNGKKQAEWLLNFLQDGVIPGPLGMEPQPKITLIAATTDPAKIPESILSRFPLKPPMRDYTTEEAATIAVLLAKAVLVDPDGLLPFKLPTLKHEEAVALAEAAHNNPRAMTQLLTVLRDMTFTEELVITRGRYDVGGLLEAQGITADGLDVYAQRYLTALATEFDGSAGAKALEDRLSQPGGLDTIERVLMDKGLIAKTRTGRALTQAGIKRFRQLELAA